MSSYEDAERLHSLIDDFKLLNEIYDYENDRNFSTIQTASSDYKNTSLPLKTIIEDRTTC